MGRSHEMPRRAGEFDGDDTGATILHVDMDAFFASVEIRRRPELRGRPVVVGGSHRGVVAAASYEARRFGVRSAMPMSQALRRCPDAVVLSPDRTAYSEASAAVMAILRDVTPLVEPLSLDEAFLDVSGSVRALGRPVEIARHIRHRVAREQQLTCSVGLAGTKFMAKLASARCKPDGLLVVPVERTLEVLHPLPVTVLWGVGDKTAAALHRLGIRSVGDLAGTEMAVLERAIGSAQAQHLSALAHGRDPRTVDVGEGEKSISSDRTLDVDLTAAVDVHRELLRLSDDVARRLRSRALQARTVGIKIRFADFRTVTRVRTLPDVVDDASGIHRVAVELYESLGLDRPRVRLVGVKAERLTGAGEHFEQLALEFDARRGPVTAAPARAAADRALDLARARFGGSAVGYATLLPADQADDPPVRSGRPAEPTSEPPPATGVDVGSERGLRRV